jgi:hypothetical protein
MAFPFQQWPKFGDYLDWAVRQGCRTFHGCIFAKMAARAK